MFKEHSQSHITLPLPREEHLPWLLAEPERSRAILWLIICSFTPTGSIFWGWQTTPSSPGQSASHRFPLQGGHRSTTESPVTHGDHFFKLPTGRVQTPWEGSHGQGLHRRRAPPQLVCHTHKQRISQEEAVPRQQHAAGLHVSSSTARTLASSSFLPLPLALSSIIYSPRLTAAVFCSCWHSQAIANIFKIIFSLISRSGFQMNSLHQNSCTKR